MGMFDFNDYDGPTHDDWGMPIKRDENKNQETDREQLLRIIQLEKRILQLENQLNNNNNKQKR